MVRRLGAAALVGAMLAGIAPANAYLGAPGFLPSIVYDENFPDPHVIQVDGIYYAYATNTGGPKIPTLWSLDLETWITHGEWDASVHDNTQFGNDALVETPNWAAPTPAGNEVWAPAVVETRAGWRAYYSIRESNGSRPRYCVSVASGPGPLGPFRDRSEEPLTCGYGPAGAIDPWVHVDSTGTAWLAWKVEPFEKTEIEDDDVHFPLSEEDIKARPPHSPLREIPESGAALWAQELDDDATWFADEAEAGLLLAASSSNWERGIVENPAMFVIDGRLHLLYSGNRWGSPDYATGWARCDTPTGPCHRAAEAPILASNETENGPGGASVFVNTHGEHQVAYHAWNAPYSSYPPYPACDSDGNRVCKDEGQRFLHINVLCTLPTGKLLVGVPHGWDFCDTDIDSWMGPGVAWLNESGVTTGVSPHYFAPNRAITRAETVTMLWRWAGSPSSPAATTFNDLRADAFYIDAVRWAAEVGIVRGTTPTTFDPDDPITRAQVATILHRAAGAPLATAPSSLTDVPAEQFFTEAVRWLAEMEITTGLTPTQFAPNDLSTRAQLAAMLCRNSRLPRNAESLIAPAANPCA